MAAAGRERSQARPGNPAPLAGTRGGTDRPPRRAARFPPLSATIRHGPDIDDSERERSHLCWSVRLR
ncbi:phage DNA packaging protein J [Catellatospora coxensis]